MVTENDDFVAPGLMKFHQIVASHILIRIVEVESLFQVHVTSLRVICLVELGGHLTPDFNTLDSRKVPLILEVNPICFIEFWSHLEMQVADFSIFSHQSCCQSQLAVYFDSLCDFSEILSWYNLDFIKKHKAPIFFRDEFHHFVACGLLIPDSRIAQHAVCADEDYVFLVPRFLVIIPQKLIMFCLRCSVDSFRAKYENILRIY